MITTRLSTHAQYIPTFNPGRTTLEVLPPPDCRDLPLAGPQHGALPLIDACLQRPISRSEPRKPLKWNTSYEPSMPHRWVAAGLKASQSNPMGTSGTGLGLPDGV